MMNRLETLRRGAVLVATCLFFAQAALAQDETETTRVDETVVTEVRVEAKLAVSIEDREVAEEAGDLFEGDVVYLWMRITGGPTDPVQVTWTAGEFSYSTHLTVGGNPWRTWAKKTLFKAATWQVAVHDSDGIELYKTSFDVLETPVADEVGQR